MRILVGTPAAGGEVTTHWLLSFISTYSEVTKLTNGQSVLQHLEAGFRAAKDGGLIDLKSFVEKTVALPKIQAVPPYEVGLYTMANESLIGRGRNHIAQVALSGGWDKLFFIDADAGWTWPQFKAVVDSKSDIVAGACPLKIYPISLNYFPNKEDSLKYHPDGQKSMENFCAMRDGHKKDASFPEIEVDFMGTAFMCISRKALLKVAEIADSYLYPNPQTGNQETHWDFFKTSSVGGRFMSEDWGFCHLARSLGMKVMLRSDVIINHTGHHTFHAPNLSEFETYRKQRIEGERNAVSTNP